MPNSSFCVWKDAIGCLCTSWGIDGQYLHLVSNKVEGYVHYARFFALLLANLSTLLILVMSFSLRMLMLWWESFY